MARSCRSGARSRSQAFNWRATRDDDFHPPIVKGMAKTKPTSVPARASCPTMKSAIYGRTRSSVAAIPGAGAHAVLTATRRLEAARMRWDEIEAIPGHPSRAYKTKNDHAIP